MHDEPNRIRIYVAADRAELGGVLDELGAFVAGRNRRCVRDGVVIEVAERGAESEDPGTAPADSSYFVTLVGSTAPGFVVGDFDEAWEAGRAYGSPKVSAWRSLCEGEEPSPEAEAFVARLRGELLHYVPRLEHPAQLQLRVWQWLDADGALASPLEVRDGWARSGGDELVDMSGVPMYAGNAGIAAKRAEIEALDELFAVRAASGGPMSPGALEADKKRLGARGELRAMERSLLDACRRADEAEARGTASWRTVKARELLEAGNYGGALAVLDDPDRGAEYEHARALAAEGLRRIEQNIEEDRAWIAARLAAGRNPEVTEAVRARYEEATAKALESHSCPDVLLEYAEFLWMIYDIARTETVVRSYLNELSVQSNKEPRKTMDAKRILAESLSKQAIMLGLGNKKPGDNRDSLKLFDEATTLLEEASSFHIQLMQSKPSSYNNELDWICCILAYRECIYRMMMAAYNPQTRLTGKHSKEYRTSHKEYTRFLQQEVDRLEEIALQARSKTIPILADTCEKLAILYVDQYIITGRRKPEKLGEMEKLLVRASRLHEEIADSESSVFLRYEHLMKAARDIQEIGMYYVWEDNVKAEHFSLRALNMYEALKKEGAEGATCSIETEIDSVYYHLFEAQSCQGKEPTPECEAGWERAMNNVTSK